MENKGRGPSHMHCLVVYDIEKDVTKEVLRDQFQRYGQVLSTHVTRSKVNRPMGFVHMTNKRDIATAIAYLHEKPPLNWFVKLSEPTEVREQRRNARFGKAPTEEIPPDAQAKIAEFLEYETEIFQMVEELSSDVRVEVSPSRRLTDVKSRYDEGAVVYEPRLSGLPPLPCSVCATPTAGHCQRCKTRYCSRQCQVRDWDIHCLLCREPELPSLVVTAGGDAARPQRGEQPWHGRGGRAAHRGHGSRHIAGGDQSEAESTADGVRGRGGQRGCARGTHRGGGDGRPGRLSDSDGRDDLLSPDKRQRPPAPAGRSPLRPQPPPETPTRPVVARLSALQLSPSRAAAAAAPRPPPLLPTPAPSSVSLLPGNTYQVAVSHVEDPGTVYLRLQEKLAHTNAMESELQREAAAAAAVSGRQPPTVGQLCAAQFENAWYRAEVLAAADGQFRVQFVDWGNTASVPTAVVVPLPPRFAVWPRQAVAARPIWQPAAADGWTEPQRRAASALAQSLLTADVTGRDGDRVTVTLADQQGRDPLAAAAAPPAATTSRPAAGPAAAGTAPVSAAAASPRPVAVPAPAASRPVAVPAREPARPVAAPAPSAPRPASVPAPEPARPVAAALAEPGAVTAPPLGNSLPNNLPVLCTAAELELIPVGPLQDDALIVVGANEEFIECATELEALPAEPTVSAQTGDEVVAVEDGTPSRALVCGRGPAGYKLLFVDSGGVLETAGPLRPLPARWSLRRLAPMALCLRLPAGAPAGARAALLAQQEEPIVVRPRQPPAPHADQVPGEARAAGLTVPLLLLSCRHLLDQLGTAADTSSPTAVVPPPPPAVQAAAAAAAPVVQYVQLSPDRQYVVLPTAMEHPQRVSAQLQDPAVYRPYLVMATRLQQAAAAGSPVQAPPPAGSLVAVHCEVVGAPAVWRRAVLLDSGGHGLQLRLVDWAVTLQAQLADLRMLDASFAQDKAIGVEFGLSDIPRDACSEDEMGFYRKKLLNMQYLMEQTGVLNGVPQAVLNLLSSTNTCFNEKMKVRLANVGRAAAAPQASETPPLPARQPQTSPQQPRPSPQPASQPAPQPAPQPPSVAAGPAPALFTHDLPSLKMKAGDKIPFLVTEVVSPANAYATPLTDEAVTLMAELDKLLPSLAERAPPLAEPQPEQLVLAPAAAVSVGWSRGAALEVSGGVAQVWFIDHGRLEPVPADKLRLLPPQAARIPAIAVDLSLAGYDRLSGPHAELAQQSLMAGGAEPLELELVSGGTAGEGYVVRSVDIDARLRAAGAAI